MLQRTIRDIIEGQDPVTAPAAMTVSEAASLMRQRQVGALMVINGEGLAGVFTERDALFRVVAEGRDPRATQLAEVMTSAPRTIAPDQPFVRALHMMHEHGFRHVPVVEEGRPIGMVSARDALGSELEDFVYELLRQEQVTSVLA